MVSHAICPHRVYKAQSPTVYCMGSCMNIIWGPSQPLTLSHVYPSCEVLHACEYNAIVIRCGSLQWSKVFVQLQQLQARVNCLY